MLYTKYLPDYNLNLFNNFIYRGHRIEMVPGTESPFEKQKNKLLKKINEEASYWEKRAKEENDYAGYGNLGDLWWPSIDNLFNLYKKEIDKTKGKERQNFKKQMLSEFTPVVNRLHEYVKMSPSANGDVNIQRGILNYKTELLKLSMEEGK